MRRGDCERALEEFNLAVKLNSRPEPLHYIFTTGAGCRTLRKRYDASLADFAEAQKVNPDGPQVPAYRCITYTEHGQIR